MNKKTKRSKAPIIYTTLLMPFLIIGIFQNCGEQLILQEQDEMFTTEFSSTTASGPVLSGDDVVRYRYSIGDILVTPGEEAVITLILDQVFAQDVNFDFETVNGTAKAGTHYQEQFGTATIKAGEYMAEIHIPTNNLDNMDFNQLYFIVAINFHNDRFDQQTAMIYFEE